MKSCVNFCKTRSISWLLLLLSSPPFAAEDISWVGCGITKKAFMSEIASAYQQKTGIRVKLSGGGATKGIRGVACGDADMGGTCRHWLWDQAGEIIAREKDAELIQVAWDALVVIVHPDNPVNDIAADEVRKVYNAEITSWKTLGGEDQEILLVARRGMTTGVGHMARLMIFGDPLHPFKARTLKVTASSSLLEQNIANIPTTMGLTGVSSAKKRDVKILSINGVAPTKENIMSGRYPYFRPLYIAINRRTAPLKARKLAEFMLSEEGQAVISAQGTVNLREGEKLVALWAKKQTAWQR